MSDPTMTLRVTNVTIDYNPDIEVTIKSLKTYRDTFHMIMGEALVEVKIDDQFLTQLEPVLAEMGLTIKAKETICDRCGNTGELVAVGSGRYLDLSAWNGDRGDLVDCPECNEGGTTVSETATEPNITAIETSIDRALDDMQRYYTTYRDGILPPLAALVEELRFALKRDIQISLGMTDDGH